MQFQRITVNPAQMGGVPCIRGLRIPVATVVGMVAGGMTNADILGAYPDLELEDIQQALYYAADTDFGTLLALWHAREPSIILYRGNAVPRPQQQATLLLANLTAIEQALHQGSIVVFDEKRIRIHSLPVGGAGSDTP